MEKLVSKVLLILDKENELKSISFKLKNMKISEKNYSNVFNNWSRCKKELEILRG